MFGRRLPVAGIVLCVILLLWGAAGTARAYAIDFEAYPDGYNVESIMDIPGVSFYGVAGWHVYAGGGFGIMTGNVITNFNHEGMPLTITFSAPQTNVSFKFGISYDLCQVSVNASLNGLNVYSATIPGSASGAPGLGVPGPWAEGVVTLNTAVDHINIHDYLCPGQTVAIDDLTSSASTSAPVFWQPHDHRLNPHPAAPAAAYCDEDRVTVYGLDEAQRGFHVFAVSLEEIQAIGREGPVPVGPRDPVVLRQEGRYALYRLPSGALMLVVAPGHDPGEVYTYTWDGCPMTWGETAVWDIATGGLRSWHRN